MWQNEYWNNDGSLRRNIIRQDDGTSIENIGEYEVVFDYEEQRYHCFIYAINMNEALGIFFVNHDNVTYKHIVDHMEV